jgi:hypothetical protein
MKNLILIFLIAAPSAFCQSNSYPVLICRNRTYTNATIDSVTPATVTVFWDGGGERVSMTNLPVEVQKQYHYDPVEAEKYLAAQSATKAARQARDAKSLAIAEAAKKKLGPPQRIRIVKTLGGGAVQIISQGQF